MVLQFEKFKQPLLVMGTIPFCLIGVVLGLMIFGSTLSLISLMGIIALAGVVVNNGIILIDYINLLRKQNIENNKKRIKTALYTKGKTMAEKNNGWNRPEAVVPETELEDSFAEFFSEEEEIEISEKDKKYCKKC